MDAGGRAPDVERRRLTAATLALAAARIGAQRDWKLVQMFMRLANIHWKPPAQLLEWGCRHLILGARPCALSGKRRDPAAVLERMVKSKLLVE